MIKFNPFSKPKCSVIEVLEVLEVHGKWVKVNYKTPEDGSLVMTKPMSDFHYWTKLEN